MVRLLVLSSGGSVLDWLVVRLGGDKDGVRGQRARQFVRQSRESSPLPLEVNTGEEPREIRKQHTDSVLQVQLSLTMLALSAFSIKDFHSVPSEMPYKLIADPLPLLQYGHSNHKVSARSKNLILRRILQ